MLAKKTYKQLIKIEMLRLMQDFLIKFLKLNNLNLQSCNNEWTYR